MVEIKVIIGESDLTKKGVGDVPVNEQGRQASCTFFALLNIFHFSFLFFLLLYIKHIDCGARQYTLPGRDSFF